MCYMSNAKLTYHSYIKEQGRTTRLIIELFVQYLLIKVFSENFDLSILTENLFGACHYQPGSATLAQGTAYPKKLVHYYIARRYIKTDFLDIQ